MKKLLASLLIITMLISVSVLSASAVRAPYVKGDVDFSNDLSIVDATLIQKHIAKAADFTDAQIAIADTDGDNGISIIDATYIQMKLAQVIDHLPGGDSCFIDVYAEALISDYSSGRAMVNVPVTFTAIASSFSAPLTYTFYVDGEIAREASTDNTFVYTFKEAKIHTVEFIVSNPFGITSSEFMELQVVENKAEGLTIQSVYHKGFYDSNITFGAIAGGGEAPYEYSFSLYHNLEGDSSTPGIAGAKILSQDFSENNEFIVSSDLLRQYADYTLFVGVRDANCKNGQEVMTWYEFTYILPPPA